MNTIEVCYNCIVNGELEKFKVLSDASFLCSELYFGFSSHTFLSLFCGTPCCEDLPGFVDFLIDHGFEIDDHDLLRSLRYCYKSNKPMVARYLIILGGDLDWVFRHVWDKCMNSDTVWLLKHVIDLGYDLDWQSKPLLRLPESLYRFSGARRCARIKAMIFLWLRGDTNRMIARVIWNERGRK